MRFQIARRLLVVWVCTVLLFSAVATADAPAPGASEPRDDQRADGLTLTVVSPHYLAGTFRRGDVEILFEISTDEIDVQFLLQKASGQALIEARSSDGIVDYSILDKQFRISMSLEDLKLLDQIQGLDGSKTPKGLEPRITDSLEAFKSKFIGFPDAIEKLALTPEYQALPWLSRELGVQGINGRDYPVSLLLHMQAKAAAQLLEIDVPPLQGTLALKASCVEYPYCDDDCFGMCGSGCSCWTWVCGDCCCHLGCETHDLACRTCSFRPSTWPECVECAIPVNFFSGGACASCGADPASACGSGTGTGGGGGSGGGCESGDGCGPGGGGVGDCYCPSNGATDCAPVSDSDDNYLGDCCGSGIGFEQCVLCYFDCAAE